MYKSGKWKSQYNGPLLPAFPLLTLSKQVGGSILFFPGSNHTLILSALACRYLPSGTIEVSACQFQGRDHLVCEKDLCDNDLRDEMTLASSH